MSSDSSIVKVVWKDEGDFGFISTYTADDLEVGGARGARPFDPDRVRPYGSLADAEALAREHGAELEIS
jgi:hypothetical protein